MDTFSGVCESGVIFEPLTFKDICQKLCLNKNTIILSHINPDADTLGCAFSLKILIEMLGSHAKVVCGSEIPHSLEFLSYPQKSILYDDLSSDISHDYVMFDRIIAVDVASPSQLGTLYPIFEEKIDFMIDHHSRGTPFADHYVEETASAAGEIVFSIYEYMVSTGLISSIPKNVCEYIYAAISSDTGCFKYSNVTPHTHIIASKLVDTGIDFAEINRRLFDCLSPDRLKLQRAVLNSIVSYSGGKIAAAAFSFEKIRSLAIPYEEYTHAIDIVRSIEGVELSIVLRQPNEENKFFLSMRSSSDADVSAICAVFGGGGHSKASGATFNADSIEVALAMIVAESEKALTSMKSQETGR